MALRTLIASLGLLGTSLAWAQPGTPPFVDELIARFESPTPDARPDGIWQYQYLGATVYYIPRLACCDIMGWLYDVKGKLVCRPDGGVGGSGDGRCPDFFEKRRDGQLLWQSGPNHSSKRTRVPRAA